MNRPLPLPEGLSLDSVLTIGQVTMTIQCFIRYGYVVQEGTRFYQVSTRPTLLMQDSSPTKPNPYSLRSLERAGWKVLPGRTAADDLVMFQPGTWCRISDAVRNNLLTNQGLKP